LETVVPNFSDSLQVIHVRSSQKSVSAVLFRYEANVVFFEISWLMILCNSLAKKILTMDRRKLGI
jgi:hypothetical protein